jgi:outer membrane scaffolding protein for murein synthesis (MipA/OmpV family)
LPVPALAADIFDDAIDIVNQGLDVIIPGDFNMRDIRARAGLGIGLAPEFVGADDYSFRALPMLDITYKDKFRLFGTQATLRLYSYEWLHLGALVRYRAGRGEGDSPDLQGLGKIGGGFEAGGYVEARFKRTVLRTRFSQDISGEQDGLTIFMTADQGVYRSPDGKFAAALGTRLTWTSKKFTQAFYGINEEQSLNSGLDVFEAGSSFRDATIRGFARYDLSDHWRLSGLIQLSRLMGDAKDSPLVQERGDANQVVTGVALFYEF